jgi:hypothetical protein
VHRAGATSGRPRATLKICALNSRETHPVCLVCLLISCRCRAEASGVVEGAPATAAAITPSQTQLQQARQIAELSLESYRYHKAPEPEAEVRRVPSRD